jgi:hypothetical protein
MFTVDTRKAKPRIYKTMKRCLKCGWRGMIDENAVTHVRLVE